MYDPQFGQYKRYSGRDKHTPYESNSVNAQT